MGKEGNMPKFFSHTNKKNAPTYAMLFQLVIGMCMIPLGSPEMILAASSFGFCIALGMSMLCFIKFRREDRWTEVRSKRKYIAPRGWYGVALVLMIYQFFVLIPCCAIWSMNVFGIQSVVLGALILLAYIPLWILLQYKNTNSNNNLSKEVAETSILMDEKE